MSPSAIGRRLVSGEWMSMLRSTYRASEVPDGWQQRVVAGALWLSSGLADPTVPARKLVAVSHLAAARVWRISVPETELVEVSAHGSRRSPAPWLRIHQSELLRWDVVRQGPIVVTNPTRTLIDIAGVMEEEALENALEGAVRRGLTGIAALKWRVALHAGPGKKGIGLLRALVEARGPRTAAAESPLEVKLARIIRASSLPVPERQVRILDGSRFVARVDFAYPFAKMAIEVDGYRFHGDAAAWRRDRRKGKELPRLGWLVLRFTSEDLEHPEQVIMEIRDALAPRLPIDR